ncbi:hypothetical protein KC329_g47 [Hortaea werneckii]|nr:hypothetical protein KC329_g47 [Hortaea werneckii]
MTDIVPSHLDSVPSAANEAADELAATVLKASVFRTLSAMIPLGHSHLLATKFFEQHLGMYEIDHVITSSVQHHDPFTTNEVSKLAKLGGVFVALQEFASCKAVAVRWERLFDIFCVVWSFKPFGRVAIRLHLGYLSIDRFGYHKIDPVAKVFQFSDPNRHSNFQSPHGLAIRRCLSPFHW